MSDKANWRQPASIAFGLLGGGSLAFGHHFYYSSLAGTLVEADRSVAGHQFSDQQFHTTIGTAFSFLVQALLMFSISTAYIQIVWQAAKHPSEANKLEEIDALFSALANILALRMVSVWKKYPLLLMIVLCGWLFPVAFVVPPATLFIAVAVRNTSTLQHVPNFDFSSLRYLKDIPPTCDISRPGDNKLYKVYTSKGPNEEVRRIAASTAASGLILPISPIATNSSWELDFYGPSIRCLKIDEELKVYFEQDIANWLWNESSPNCLSPPGYVAWRFDIIKAPIHHKFHSEEITGPNEIHGPFRVVTVDNLESLMQGQYSGVFIALAPELLSFENPCYPTHRSPSRPLGSFDSTIFQCGLHNASYHTKFEFQSGTQSIAMQVNHLEALDTAKYIVGLEGDIMDCFQLASQFLLPTATSKPCAFDLSALRILSYSAIMRAFHELIQGSISMDSFERQWAHSSAILSTVLYETPDLDFIHTYRGDARTLQWELQHVNDSRGGTLEPSINLSLPDAIEQLFQNITISLLSSKPLQPNLTSEFAPPKVNVSMTSHSVEYNYSAGELAVAYGTAAAVAIAVISVGFIAIRSNGASYTTDFSSIYRVAHQAVLSIAIRPEDTDGAYPLADYLGKARLSLKGTSRLPCQIQITQTQYMLPNKTSSPLDRSGEEGISTLEFEGQKCQDGFAESDGSSITTLW
ncbi:hypothetical protein F5B22DRAFT_643025 [Xylaria bambusicola]|uniref:uncharacterized protein n=1 Tax=Xylaria bambusicola TaxID=326684 RepID=UPI002008A9BF|nr:uncharacterized protein F5B22DRAFT_643025 [Xylaria bambusicola]KAI0523918.1 hypothetical protein F5B22DRAFT_643025 [Xylaria bambusicola]